MYSKNISYIDLVESIEEIESTEQPKPCRSDIVHVKMSK